MENDDAPVGRILTRREALALFGAVGAATLAACATGQSGTTAPTSAGQPPATLNAEAQTAAAIAQNPTAAEATATAVATAASVSTAVPSCVVVPELTEGPYFVDVKLNRSDIRSDSTTGDVSPGVPLALTFNVSQISNNACTPLAGATVDVWHCDAVGTYSGVQGSTGTNFLRGYQVTDANGKAAFLTIYPGWYQGRTVHIHFKIRTTGTINAAYEFTSQLFFDEGVTDEVYAQAPYSSKGKPDTTNARDSIFQEQTLLTPSLSNDKYNAALDIALDLSDTQVGASDAAGGGPGGV